MDCTLPGSSVHEILQVRLEWVAMPSSRVGLPQWLRQILYQLSYQEAFSSVQSLSRVRLFATP